ncbi:MAG: outer membrane beta-barrel protein, partial [Muribaculaceae bacterium]|nr:outer membrane beta-barrel protein [Muribaculaceae bacterium]
MLKYYVCPSLSIDLGPQIGFNVYSKRVLDGSKETTDLKDNTNSIDLGIGLGLTYNITNDVFVQGRYTLGLTEVYKSSVEEKHMKNGNAQIAIGYRF